MGRAATPGARRARREWSAHARFVEADLTAARSRASEGPFDLLVDYLDAASLDRDDPTGEREAVRRELGVADGDRLLLVSTVNLPFMRQTHFAHMLKAVLGAPLPNVHVVFKQHPGERDNGPYRELLLALAGCIRLPAAADVRGQDIDLYRLLRAATAHLGLLSTVLTEAVVVGTPNLITIPTRTPTCWGMLRRASRILSERRPRPGRARRGTAAGSHGSTSVLDRHFRAGDATERVLQAVVGEIGQPSAAGRTRASD